MDRQEKLRILKEDLDDLPEEIYDELLVILVKTTWTQLQELEKALSDGDHTTAKSLVHSIKGSAANLRVGALQLSARNLEVALARATNDGRFEQEMLAINRALRSLEDEVKGG